MPNPDRQALTDQIVAALPASQAEIARAVGRKPSDGTVRRRLATLESDGVAKCVDGTWQRVRGLPELPGYEFPDDFDEEAIDLFTVTVRELLARPKPEWETSDVDLLEAYVRCMQRARVARDQDEMFTYAESGRAYTHPSVAIAREAERDAQVYRKALLITPEARAAQQKGDDRGADPGDDEFTDLDP